MYGWWRKADMVLEAFPVHARAQVPASLRLYSGTSLGRHLRELQQPVR
jgi:hypothetical protein